MLMNANITGQQVITEAGNLTRIYVDDQAYLVSDKFFETNFLDYDENALFKVYQDQAAIRNSLKGVITEVNGNEIISLEGLRQELDSNEMGEEINIKVDNGNEIIEKQVVLQESYNEEGKKVLGIVIGEDNPFRVFAFIEFFREYGVEYRSSGNQEIMQFIYELIAWIVLINLLVGFINMLPVGIFDGGRFFYLTILAITKREGFAKKSFSAATWIILLLIVLMIVVWGYRRFLIGA